MMVSMSSTADWQAVLLDLLNTTPVIDGKAVDQLADMAAARAWLRAHAAGRGEDVDAVRTLRDDLQRVVRMDADASVLRRYLSEVHQVPDIGPDGVDWSLDADWPARVVLAWANWRGTCRADCGRVPTTSAGCSSSTARAPGRPAGAR